MSIRVPHYLALSEAEFSVCSHLPEHFAWLDCRFSSIDAGLTGLPKSLAPGGLLVLTDRTEPSGHSPRLVCRQLEAAVDTLGLSGVLLDFQRPAGAASRAMAEEICRLPFPVGVTEAYASYTQGPVFLTVPMLTPLSQVLAPYRGRPIWLDTCREEGILTLTAAGASYRVAPHGKTPVHRDARLFCGYSYALTEKSLEVYLCRDLSHWAALLEKGREMGVERAVGLYQEF